MGKNADSSDKQSAFSDINHFSTISDLDLSDHTANSLHRLANTFFSMAVKEYSRHGDWGDITEFLRRCGQTYLDFYRCEELPEQRDILDVYYRALPCIVCFGEESELTRFTELEEWRYCWPPLDSNPVEWNIVNELNVQSNVRRYLRETLKFLASGKLDEAACSELNSSLQSSQGVDKKTIAKELCLGLLSLQAIQNQQCDELRHHLLNLIKSHQQRASRGRLRGDENGVLAMQALMLAFIAQQRGLELDLSAEYAPMQLLGRQ